MYLFRLELFFPNIYQELKLLDCMVFNFSFLSNHHTVYHSGCINLHEREGSFFSTSSQTFVICILFDDNHFDRSEGLKLFIVDLICISLIISDIEDQEPD